MVKSEAAQAGAEYTVVDLVTAGVELWVTAIPVPVRAVAPATPVATSLFVPID